MPKNEYICDCNTVHGETVADTVSKMPSVYMMNCVADFFKVMGDSTRCRLLFALMQNELCVCDLANVLSMTKSSISHQLSKMREAGIVKARRSGKTVYYSLDDDHIAEIFKVGLEHIKHII